MRRLLLILPVLALLGACSDFDKGDTVSAKVGRARGDKCLVAIMIDAESATKSRTLVTRIQAPECEPARAPAPEATP